MIRTLVLVLATLLGSLVGSCPTQLPALRRSRHTPVSTSTTAPTSRRYQRSRATTADRRSPLLTYTTLPTTADRALIQSALDPANLRDTVTLKDGSSLAKYFRTLSDGTQAWAEVRGGQITNGGLNVIPR